MHVSDTKHMSVQEICSVHEGRGSLHALISLTTVSMGRLGTLPATSTSLFLIFTGQKEWPLFWLWPPYGIVVTSCQGGRSWWQHRRWPPSSRGRSLQAFDTSSLITDAPALCHSMLTFSTVSRSFSAKLLLSAHGLCCRVPQFRGTSGCWNLTSSCQHRKQIVESMNTTL